MKQPGYLLRNKQPGNFPRKNSAERKSWTFPSIPSRVKGFILLGEIWEEKFQLFPYFLPR
jgi:hypothetical protein